MRIEDAVARLDELGCGNDPIVVRGKYHDVSDLLYLEDVPVGLDAMHVRLSYWGGTRDHVHFVRNGTLSGMLKNREKLERGEGPQAQSVRRATMRREKDADREVARLVKRSKALEKIFLAYRRGQGALATAVRKAMKEVAE